MLNVWRVRQKRVQRFRQKSAWVSLGCLGFGVLLTFVEDWGCFKLTSSRSSPCVSLWHINYFSAFPGTLIRSLPRKINSAYLCGFHFLKTFKLGWCGPWSGSGLVVISCNPSKFQGKHTKVFKSLRFLRWENSLWRMYPIFVYSSLIVEGLPFRSSVPALWWTVHRE